MFSASLIFNNNINELWLYLRDVNNDIKIIDYFDRLQYIEGKNTWILGNKFSYDWIGLTHLNIICTLIKEEIDKKVIQWRKSGDIGIKYYKTLYLYKINKSNETLVKINISRTEEVNELIDITPTLKNYYKNIVLNELNLKSKYLQNKKKDLISYQSCIINSNYMNVWKLVTNLKKMSEITPSIGSNMEYNGSSLKVGTFIKYLFPALNIVCFMKITEIKKPKKRKILIYNLQTIGCYISSLPKYIEYKVAIINDNKTHLSVLHKFPNNTNQEFIEIFNINKKEALIKYKQFLEEK